MKKIYTVYAAEDDMTFIMEETYSERGILTALECIGWYFGEPDEECNKTFAHKLKASYERADEV